MASSPSLAGRRDVRRRSRVYERRIRLWSLVVIAPSLATACILLWHVDWATESKLTLLIFLVVVTLIFEAVLHDHVIRPLQTLTNVISSLREEDFSFRARDAAQNDALGELAHEINCLADQLSAQKTDAVEATELLRRVVEEIDVPLFTFDPADRLRLVNTAGARLLQQPGAQLLGKTTDEIGLEPYLQPGSGKGSGAGSQVRWMVRRTSFREKGVPHTLIVLSDVSRALREEERSAWQRLIRVLGHELNNSLTPIKSIAGTLLLRLKSVSLGEAERRDFEKGLGIVESRAASLNRFLQAYRQVAQIPRPKVRLVPLRPLLERVASLELRVPVQLTAETPAEISADPDQLEQVLINLLRNAAEATLGVSEPADGAAVPAVQLLCSGAATEGRIIIEVVDSGPGLLNPENTFVPFYTTKPSGSGIGLVLSRQIVEAHGGTLELINRSDARGCIARLML